MTSERHVRVFVDPIYEPHRGLIAAAITCLLEMSGWRSEAVFLAADADLRYVNAAETANSLPSVSPAAWSALASSEPRRLRCVVPDHAVASGNVIDWVAVAAFFLSGMHELDARIMESTDVWATPGPEIARWGLDHEPTVHVAASIVAEYVVRARPGSRPAPRWPQGKRYAIAITHDLDRFRKYRAREFVRFAARSYTNGHFRGALTSAAKAMVSTIAERVTTDPYMRSLQAWAEFQRNHGIRSAIYASVVARSDPDAAENDVPYFVHDVELIRTLRSLEDKGWEIGLHSSIHAWRTEAGFSRERALLHEVLSASTVGMRGHFWSLDPTNRDESLRRVAAAGFQYDSSLGMNLVHGYRRGSNYPYRPFSALRGEPLGVWEIPPTVMDQSLLLAGKTTAERRAALEDRFQEVQRNEGLLVLDWHTDSLSPGYMEDSTVTVLELLAREAANSECWVATPRELTAWCAIDRWNA